MQVVCSFAGGAGHLVPQFPLHRALALAGHHLTLLGRESAVQSLPGGTYGAVIPRPDRRTRVTETIAPLVPVDVEHELAVVGRHFAGDAALRSAAAVETVLPGADLVVCDELDFGALAAAQKAGVPTVVVSVIASGALVRPYRLIGPLEALGQKLGMSTPIRPQGDFYVVPFHPSMRDPRFPAPEDALWMRPDTGPTPRPDGSVVATLGTEFNTESGNLFDRILAALGGADASATVAIGRDLDPERFGIQPSHVHVTQHVDFDVLIPHASVVLHHGGSGMFLRSVLGGAPQVVFPMGADQPFTADQVERLGLGLVLDPATASATRILEAVTELGSGDSARERVSLLRHSTLALPAPGAVVAHLEAALT